MSSSLTVDRIALLLSIFLIGNDTEQCLPPEDTDPEDENEEPRQSRRITTMMTTSVPEMLSVIVPFGNREQNRVHRRFLPQNHKTEDGQCLLLSRKNAIRLPRSPKVPISGTAIRWKTGEKKSRHNSSSALMCVVVARFAPLEPQNPIKEEKKLTPITRFLVQETQGITIDMI